jgi:malate dehydrogenase (oxaloacetate-decarboxylating)
LVRIDQTNNAYVYPGVGLGVIAAKARHISDGMFLAAARALAELSPAKRDARANLLPPLVELPAVSLHVAIAVARQAQMDGLAVPSPEEELIAAVRAKMWEPAYPTLRRASPPRTV